MRSRAKINKQTEMARDAASPNLNSQLIQNEMAVGNNGKIQYRCCHLVTDTTRQSEMANTSPATCQCLATFTPFKSKILIFIRDVISLLAQVVILLIDTATQEVPMKNI